MNKYCRKFLLYIRKYKCDWHSTGRVYIFKRLLGEEKTLIYKVVTFDAVQRIASKKVFFEDRYKLQITHEIKSVFWEKEQPEKVIFSNWSHADSIIDKVLVRDFISQLAAEQLRVYNEGSIHKGSKRRYNLFTEKSETV